MIPVAVLVAGCYFNSQFSSIGFNRGLFAELQMQNWKGLPRGKQCFSGGTSQGEEKKGTLSPSGEHNNDPQQHQFINCYLNSYQDLSV